MTERIFDTAKKTANILLVEDNASEAECVRWALEKYGYGVTWVSDGLDAMAAMSDP